MRLPKRLKDAIDEGVSDSFGDVDIYLFGSRVDDDKRGGDIDIAIDTNISRIEFRKKKIKFIISMMKKNLDLKIDLVKYKSSDTLLSDQIKKNAILLS